MRAHLKHMGAIYPDSFEDFREIPEHEKINRLDGQSGIGHAATIIYMTSTAPSRAKKVFKGYGKLYNAIMAQNEKIDATAYQAFVDAISRGVYGTSHIPSNIT